MTCDQVRDLAAAFVLDALEPDEERAVREHLAECPEAHAEIAGLGGVLPYVAESVDQVEPPAGLGTRILAAAAADLEARRAGSLGGPPLAAPRAAVGPDAGSPVATFPGPAERDARARARTAPAMWLVRIAAAITIVALGGWNLLLQGQLGDARSYEDGVAAVLELASRPGSQAAILAAPAGDGPRGIAAVAADGSIRIAMRDLDPTSGSEVYEAWIIGGDGVPVPIGGFAVGAGGMATLTADASSVESGLTVALTREPGPGATTPTLPIVSAGVASAPPG